MKESINANLKGVQKLQKALCGTRKRKLFAILGTTGIMAATIIVITLPLVFLTGFFFILIIK